MKKLSTALRIVFIYLMVGCLWILLSDWVLMTEGSPSHVYLWQTAKGLGYVLATAGLLFWLIGKDSRLLRESEARFRLLIESAPDAILVQSGGRLVYANAAALHLLGAVSAERLLGRDMLDIVHPVSRDACRERMANVMNEKASVLGLEVTCLRADGSAVVCEVSMVPVLFDRCGAALAFVRDVTARKSAQEQQSNAQKMELIRQLAGGLSHELNNLMQVVNGNIELVHASLVSEAPQQRYLEQALWAGRQVADWVSRIMAFSHSRNPSIESLKLTAGPITVTEKTLCLPRVTVPGPDSASSASESAKNGGSVPSLPPGAASSAAEGARWVLLAEDDGMVRSLTECLLHKAGYSVLVARDGAEAVGVFGENAARIAAVLLDVVMPNMNGFEAYTRIRAMDPAVPVVFASGFSGYEVPAGLALIPGENFLQKPFERSALIDIMQRAVARRG